MQVNPSSMAYLAPMKSNRLDAMCHPRCVGWGEIGLDYHYDNSPRDVQRDVFVRQLRQAVRLHKPITIHTREAEEDTERILKEEVPKDTKV
jgi:TatD DNase family protein